MVKMASLDQLAEDAAELNENEVLKYIMTVLDDENDTNVPTIWKEHYNEKITDGKTTLLSHDGRVWEIIVKKTDRVVALTQEEDVTEEALENVLIKRIKKTMKEDK